MNKSEQMWWPTRITMNRTNNIQITNCTEETNQGNNNNNRISIITQNTTSFQTPEQSTAQYHHL
jgi:hypothetical protein